MKTLNTELNLNQDTLRITDFQAGKTCVMQGLQGATPSEKVHNALVRFVRERLAASQANNQEKG